MKNIVLVMLIIIVPLSGTILQRSTFEAWEGAFPCGWSVDSAGNGKIRKAAEDPTNDYQTQAHGKWSFWLYDPNDTSHANAYKTFTNSSSEYMVEFYLWIRDNHTAPIDSFPLCVLWNIPGEGLPAKTDIALVIDTLDNPPNGGLFTIHVEDADSIHHNEVYIDSTDRWYKIQIYRYVSGSDTVVTFYLDGDSIDTYVPMNKNKVSNKISLGTTQADSLADGEVFYDNVIITDCSETEYGSHACVDTYEINNGVSEKIRIMIIQIQNLMAQINNYDVFEMVNLANFLDSNFNNLSRYEKLSYFNELVVKIDQIKLGLLYGNLNDVERSLIKRSLDFVIDRDDIHAYNLTTKGGRR